MLCCVVLDKVIYKVMFHLVYYAKSFNCSSCLEGVPLEECFYGLCVVVHEYTLWFCMSLGFSRI